MKQIFEADILNYRRESATKDFKSREVTQRQKTM